MAKTESSQKPFRILEMYLRLLDGEVLTRPEEAARYGIDIRSVQRDINALRLFLSGQTIEGFSQTVAYSRKAGGYILRGNKKDLTREEALALCKILLESRAFSKKEMENIVDKIIRSAVARREIVAAQRLVDNEKRYYEELSCCDSHLLDKIWSIGDAVSRQNMLKIRYTKKGGEKVERVVKPLSIMFSEFYFYLIGDIVQFDEDGAPFSRYGFPAVFRVDRIENFEEGDSFRVEYSKRFESGDVRRRIQYMFVGPLQHVTFEYIAGNDISHVLDRLPTAVVRKKKALGEGRFRYTVETEVYGLEGIKLWIRSQGPQIRVTAPEQLVKEIRKELQDTIGLYR